MIYLDNAATTCPKPPEVAQAIADALGSFGGVGRGVHAASFNAGMAVFEARSAVADLLGAPGADRVSFTNNVTAALNTAIDGLLEDGGVAVTTAASHNSVLRPLFKARDERKCEVRVVPVDSTGAVDMGAFTEAVKGADLVVVTHSSNLTGDVYDVAEQARIAHEAGALVVLDAAQTAGTIPVNMADNGVDVLCFTGHKGLLGPQGTGGLCVAEGLDIPPLLEGGSGTHSFEERHPRIMPESLEAGTVNAHGLAGLSAGIAYLQMTGVPNIEQHETALASKLEEGLKATGKARILGGGGIGKTGIVAFQLDGLDCSYVADTLATEYGICTRAGAHCAPLMHKALGTDKTGAVRVSVGPFNTEEDIHALLTAVNEILEGAVE